MSAANAPTAQVTKDDSKNESATAANPPSAAPSEADSLAAAKQRKRKSEQTAASTADTNAEPTQENSENAAAAIAEAEDDAASAEPEDDEDDDEGSDEEAEIDAWFYLDDQMKPQGPFTSQQMSEWYQGGYLKPTLKVMKVGEEDFVELSFRPEFQHSSVPQPTADSNAAASMEPFQFATQGQTYWNQLYEYQQQQAASLAQQQVLQKLPLSGPVAGQYQDYELNGKFNRSTGRFQAVSTEEHFSRRNIPQDKTGRQIYAFFDLEAYQDQRNKEKESGTKRAKPAKNWREMKAKKEEMKRKNYIKNILKD